MSQVAASFPRCGSVVLIAGAAPQDSSEGRCGGEEGGGSHGCAADAVVYDEARHIIFCLYRLQLLVSS